MSIITPSAAAKRLRKIRDIKPRPIPLDSNFPHQNAFVEDTSRFLAAQCSRRAGKSNGLALRFFRTLERYPKSQCIYISLTYDSAKEIIWPVLQELNDKHKLGCTFVESKMIMNHPNGSKLKIAAADQKNFIKRLKGRKYPGVAIDEAQDFGSHLQSLVDDVLTPAIADYKDGWLALTGTPGPVPHGYFFDITKNRKFGYGVHEWTLLENPYMPEPAAFIADLKKKREWDDNHPTLLREWQNNWVLDVESLWIRYKSSFSHYDTLPSIAPKQYQYIMGIDVGFNDADAIAILAWCEANKNVYLVEEVINRKQGLTELVEQIQSLEKKYLISKMVIDAGGLGKKLAEEMRRRHGIPVQDADKARKQENVEILNDNLRLGRFKAKDTSQFAKDSYLVQIDWDKSTPDRIVIKKKPHSDIIDAVLYAFKESPAFASEPVKPRLIPGTKEWAEAQPQELWDAASTHFEAQAKNDREWRQ